MQLLVAGRHIFDRRDYRLQLFLRLLELLMRFYDLLERGELLLRLTRVIEGFDQLVGLRYAFGANLDRLGFFCWDRAPTARFQMVAGPFPPAFPFPLSCKTWYPSFPALMRSRVSILAL